MAEPERLSRRAAAGDAGRKRRVPAAIRRAVWSRDSGRCTFTDSDGRRCQERAGLELHHEHAFALGGPTTAENLRLVCRAHNAFLAERDFGRAHMERWMGRRLE
jgi:5-methylcytosine-specific restriction endonuclease McrA